MPYKNVLPPLKLVHSLLLHLLPKHANTRAMVLCHHHCLGHFIGDEGSAYSIAHFALKELFDAEDGMNPSVDIAWIKAAMCEYFNVKERSEMLTHLYVCVKTKPCAWNCVKDRGRLRIQTNALPPPLHGGEGREEFSLDRKYPPLPHTHTRCRCR